MASLYKKTYPIDMPEGAKILTRRGRKIAQWTDGRGNVKTAPLARDGKRMMYVSDVWYLRYRTAEGRERRISTGCRDRQAAGRVMADVLGELEKVRAGILTPEDVHASGHADRPIREHVEDYLEYLKVKTVRGRRISQTHRYNVRKQLHRLIDECGLQRIGDITRHRITRWIRQQTDAGTKAPRTILKYRATLTAFCKWAAGESRLTVNPLIGLPSVTVDEERRCRRPLTMDEVQRLLQAAAERPLRDALTIRRGKRTGQLAAKVRPAQRERFRRLGRERALIYKTLLYTGLRKSELASLTVGDVHLEADRPHVTLAAKNAKNGKAAMIPLRSELANDLREHLEEKLAEYRRRTLADGRREVPATLPANARLLDVPDHLVRILDRDLAAAGIDKTDAHGRTVDVHSLRHTFATMLSQAGVLPRMAQELMRHSDIRLTMSTYTHLSLIDTAGAVEALPGVGA
ncbi:MAG: tyrosine-type recombinase/integrase [Planctomycetota bacterium]